MTELKLYNTLTRTKEVFEPLDPANVRMYVCGPTVYDFAHIGNARPVIVFDVLFRLLRHLYGADHVTYVRNITDVEDKINARALRDFPGLPLNEAISKVTEKTANQFFADAAALGCLEPTAQPRATQHIDGMIAMIQTLISKGNAYVATGKEGREVLFDVASMPDYGGLSKRNLEDQQAGARVAVEAHKKNPADFVLWKESSGDEPGWDASFDGTAIYGRPGWHIECSVMAKSNLGEVFDIHGGGLDLIFPHHENEIAQSRCAHGTDVMAKVWMHNGFLQVEGRKMSKSEGNFVTIHDLLETEKFGNQLWLGEVLRTAMLMSHYREPIDWTIRTLTEARDKLASWANTLLGSAAQAASLTRQASGAKPNIAPAVLDALADDLNTPDAFAAFSDLYDAARKGDAEAGHALLESAEALGLMRGDKLFAYVSGFHLGEGEKLASPEALRKLDALKIANANSSAALVGKINSDLRELGVVSQVGDDGSISYEVTGSADWSEKITHRLALLAEKKFAEADAIRDELAAQGIQLMDYKDAETGERRTKWEVKR